VESRSRPPPAPGRRLARAIPQHLLRPHLPHERVRPVPPARRGHELRHLRVGARVREQAAGTGAARAPLPDLARRPALGSPGAAAAQIIGAPTTSRSPA
jgi:hypothetical protein